VSQAEGDNRLPVDGVTDASVKLMARFDERSLDRRLLARRAPRQRRLFGAIRAEAGPFTNGSFELASVNPGAGFATLAAGSTQITGWEVFGSTIDYIGTFWEAADGNRSVDLNGNAGPAGIRQTFDTLVGATYRVEFAMAGNPDGLPDMKQVLVESGAVSDSFLSTRR
jgi:choice-of-anchor C domain-containing protein